METKPTLFIEKSILEKAKEFANNSGKSLLDLVERYLKSSTTYPSHTGIIRIARFHLTAEEPIINR
ncbi:DUF6364 family protein [Algoriphagus sp.]|uniref:DUF6364 family protein n=1 Tax=Algoriphagus sp. TaxID=1872435 RepID=UPI00342A6AFE